MTIDFAAATNPGLVRDMNEDRYVLDPQLGLCLIADGMGGHQAGEVASQIAVNIIYRTLVAASLEYKITPDRLLTDALFAAHDAIHEQGAQDIARLGMGTTAVVAWIPPPGDVLWVAHVGDSRAYLLREGQLVRLTEDHTLYNQALRLNRLPPNPEDQPSRQVLSQALGATDLIAPDVSHYALEPGDLVLLCSDGLTDMLDDSEIAQLLALPLTASSICDLLIQAANERGGKDNITVLVIRVGQSGEPPQDQP